MENKTGDSQKKNILKEFIKQAAYLEISKEEQLHKAKKQFAKKHGIALPKNFELQKVYKEMLSEGFKPNESLQHIMRKRKIRTLSGVSIITVLTKPFACPGNCVFCPSEPGMPKSYLSNEPGAMRAVLDDFDPKAQVITRLKSLEQQGHETDKIEMIVLGGTFSFYKENYQINFIEELFAACNPVACNPDTCNSVACNSKDIHNCRPQHNGRISAEKSHLKTNYSSLEKAQRENEDAKHRIIGLSLETRADHINEKEIKKMRKLGCTKVQMGVQHTDNKILALNKRGETKEHHKRAIKLLKDAGLKVAIHLMPNLAGSTPEKDMEMFKEIFDNPDYRPDQIKIYPCVVTPYSELEKWWKEGKYKSYSEETLIKIILEMKKYVPKYVRIERLYRDIPGESILEGSKKTNMRQIIEEKSQCECIRCREIKGGIYDPENTEFEIEEFEASEGKEFFLSYNDKKSGKLCSLLRLRFPSETFIKELTGAALIRELHTYGQQVKIGGKENTSSQHMGLGRKILKKGEELAKKAGYKKIAVISGVGVRNYYRKNEYELKGTYMIKKI